MLSRLIAVMSITFYLVCLTGVLGIVGVTFAFGILSVLVVVWLFQINFLWGVVGLLAIEIMPLIIAASLVAAR